ncbi:hypothetical protein LBMAG42_29110 [Deltaproteobacteria bacterium]|nr:hypothetical protein LBMAG42_29110 [Deltaproteobacteria bacterium]
MLLALAVAQAATVTDLPPFLRGDVTVSYTFDRLQGSLNQHGALPIDDAEVGKRDINAHVMHYGAAFGVAPGAAVYVDIPHTIYQSVEVSEWSKMVYDPGSETGSYLGTATAEDATLSRGNGLQGVWSGAKGTPFSQSFTGRRNRVTWLLEGAVRTPSDASWFEIAEPSTTGGIGTRGAGAGGVGLRVSSTASMTEGKTEPYIRLAYEDNLPTTIDILADDGTPLWLNCEIDPANKVDAAIGAEFVLGQNDSSGSRSAFDLHVSTAWESYQDVPTGTELPAVLLPEAGLSQRAESLELGGGIGLDLRFMKYLSLSLFGDARYHLPQRIESPYPVYTGGDTVHIVAGTQLQIRVR